MNAVLGSVVLVAGLALTGQATSAELPLGSPEAHGFDSARLADALGDLKAGGAPIHSLLVVRGGEAILDAVFDPYDGKSRHEVASVTKSVTTSLVAIAASEGRIDLDKPIVSFFPDRQIANLDARKERITVRELMEMASGLDCVAEPSEPTLAAMEKSPDWVQFTLDLKAVAEPGTTFSYCSPGMHLLSAILSRTTGMPALAYAQEKLFTPLGITGAIWPADSEGNSRGWGDLYLYPEDMAKLGLLWLHGGRWLGQQLIPADWLSAASRTQMQTGSTFDYGYGFWIGPPSATPTFFANGRGGQRIVMFPSIDAVAVVTGGGIDPGPALDRVVGALRDSENPLPPNPAGLARLHTALAAISAAPVPHPVAALPQTAAAVSGRLYLLDPNPLDIASVRLDFPGGAEATLTLGTPGLPDRALAVGLDGVLRWSPGENGVPIGVRGDWTGAKTLVVDYDTVGSIDAFLVTSTFEGESIDMTFADRASGQSVVLHGKAGQQQ